MATYEETVLALNPIHFWRLDELAGPTMTDSAVGGTDGIYDSDPTFGAVFGRPSPIETDPGSSAIARRAGLVTASAPSSNWSYGGWVYTNASLDAYIICRSGQVGLSGGNFILWDSSGVLRAHVSNASGEIQLNFIPQVNTWYWVLLTRNAAVVSLYVNDVLVDQDTGFDSGPMDNGWVDGGQFVAHGTWKIACGGDSGNLGNLGDAIDEPVIFDYPLTLAQSTAIYESALNALLLRGYSNPVPTSILYSDIEPPPTSFPFRHNWDEALIERIGFLTNVSQTADGSNEGVQVRRGVRRELEFTQVLKNHAERRALRAKLWANQNGRWFVPVRQDAELLGVAVGIGATVIPVTTAYRDYEVGGWLGLRQVADDGSITHWEEVEITAVNPTSVETSATIYAYAIGSLVYPVRRAMILPSIDIDGHTDTVEELTLTARLLPEDEPLVPNRITPFTPTWKYRDYEVFDPAIWQSNDWSDTREYVVERAGAEVDFDVGTFAYDSDTDGAQEVFSCQMKLSTRVSIAAFLGWFYERAGQLRYLWVATMQEDFEILSANPTFITVSGTNYSDNYAGAEARRDLAFVYSDNSMTLRRITRFSESPDERLELDQAVPTLTNLRSLSLLKFCQLDADQLELAWVTDEAAQVRFRFRELARTPEGVGATSLSPSGSVSPSISPSVSTSVSPSSSVSPSASVSPSVSPSQSPSSSASPSGSASPSASSSPSASISPSVSPSSSVSPSASVSPSLTPSMSESPSVSPSASISPSASASPS